MNALIISTYACTNQEIPWTQVFASILLNTMTCQFNRTNPALAFNTRTYFIFLFFLQKSQHSASLYF